MAMMARMRSLAPWFIITVGGLFVLFMVLSDSSITKLASKGRNVVGSIDGDEITYKEFSAAVERMRKQQEQSTGKEIEPEQMDQFRDQVWETLVNQKLIEKKIKDYGITVTDQEIKDALLGPNPPAELQRSFMDSTGHFDRAAYESAILDPRNKEIMIQVEEGIRQQLYQKKLQDYIFASVIVTDDEVLQTFLDQNIKTSADFAYVNSRFIPDSTVTVTDDEIKNYYNEHKDKYKREETRKVKYVLFEKKPSREDTLEIEDNLKAIIKNLKADTSTFKTYVEIYSNQPYSLDTLSIDRAPREMSGLLLAAKPGDIIGPVLTREGFVVYKYVDKLKGKDVYAHAAHILIATQNVSKENAKAKADSIYKELLNGMDFAEAARKFSDDPGSAKFGGDLGWFGKKQMVPEFEKASFNGKIGVVQKPFATRYGYHIVKVLDRRKDKFVIEKIVNKVEPSGTTIDKIYGDASDFAYLADKNDFDSEAELMKYKVAESTPFKKDSRAVSGLGAAKFVVNFAFENSVGSVSPVLKVPAGYAVVMVSDITKAGIQPLEEVESSIKAELMREKKVDKTFEIAGAIRKAINGSNDFSAAAKVFPRVKISNVKDILPTSPIPGIGRDYIFNEYCLKGELNKISDPIKGKTGSYLIKVTARTKFDSTAYSIQKNNIRNYVLQQKQSGFFASWLKNLKKETEIIDNRYKFYR
jgi:parvulin-like peptidyl-prolyl isomerase